MKPFSELEPQFVDVLPPTLQEGVLYVAMAFNTVVHLCCCGCGTRVVTPLSPADWQLQYDGSAVTLYPSIGNHQYECASHYWIRQNRVVWSYSCTSTEIDYSRASTERARVSWYDSVSPETVPLNDIYNGMTPRAISWWACLKARLRRFRS